MPDETNGINNAVSYYKVAVQFSASFVTSLFASFWQNLRKGNKFSIFRPGNTDSNCKYTTWQVSCVKFYP